MELAESHRIMRCLAFLGLVTGLLVMGCGGAGADDPAEVGTVSSAAHKSQNRLRSKSKALFWSGTVNASDAPVPGAPPECATVACDHFQLEIDLPKGTFSAKKRGGVEVSIRWNGEFDTLHLWVYKDGQLRAASPGIIATAQSTLLEAPENGTYDVWIAWEPEYNMNASVTYEALAEVEYAPKLKPLRRLLPDLEFRSTERITFDTPSMPIFEPDPPPGSSCFDSERNEDGAQNCLRFDQIIANVGNPLELWFSVPPSEHEEGDDHDEHEHEHQEFPVVQRVYSSDGSTADQPAGHVELHGIHGHYHYSSFATTELWASNAQGERLGTAPVTQGQKVSFCIADIRIDAWGEKGNGPRTYMAPDCLFPAFSDASGDHFKQGLTNGWSDVYDWYLPDQYIEVTGVPDGYYRIEFCADPDNSIEELDESNNCLTNLIRLSQMGTAQQSVELIGVAD